LGRGRRAIHPRKKFARGGREEEVKILLPATRDARRCCDCAKLVGKRAEPHCEIRPKPGPATEKTQKKRSGDIADQQSTAARSTALAEKREGERTL